MRTISARRLTAAVLGTAFAALTLLVGTAAHAQFDTELSTGHYDIEIEFEDDALALVVGVDDPLPGEPEFYDPATTIYQLQTSADPAINDQFPRPASFDFFGPDVDTGDPIWLTAAGSNDQGIAPLVGLAAEDIAPGTFVNDQLTLRLVGFSGPGQAAGFLPVPGGTPTPAFRTDNGLDATDFATIITGAGHTDYVFAFTAPGVYALTFEASGTLVSGGTRTGTGTYNFGVNFVNVPVVVPEAGTVPLMLGAGCSVLGGLVIRRRGKKA
ncbi:MAG: TIGR03769 domain-containing protein [Akkermansiaceae bacterium]|nr:TIGR03769 domain-containing protein [Armatimonadota bacterium]